MPVGKAKAAAPDSAEDDFQFTVPCLTEIDRDQIADHLKRDQFFWLDLTGPSEERGAALATLFGFHPLALEDAAGLRAAAQARQLRQLRVPGVLRRPRGAAGRTTELSEVHMFISGQYLITIHRERAAAHSTSSASSSRGACCTASSS